MRKDRICGAPRRIAVKLGRVAAILCLSILSGCATVMPDYALQFECTELGQHMYPYQPEATAIDPNKSLEALIAQPAIQDPMLRAMAAQAGDDAHKNLGLDSPPTNILLLSGGGQWGAYGAGYLGQLHVSGRLPDFQVVNGISTGSLQALYLGAGRPEDLIRLPYIYRQNTSLYGRANGMIGGLYRGSLTSLTPLRTTLRTELCGADYAHPCRMLDALRNGSRQVYVGLIHAPSGAFYYVDIVGMLRSIYQAGDSPETRRRAQECVAAAAMGSSSVPVMLQRVKIAYEDRDGTEQNDIFYDGGARYSVFDATIAMRAEQASRPSQVPAINRHTVALYIIRNGPLDVIGDRQVNDRGDILTNAKRGYSILVNQNEIMSINAMRLYYPTGSIRYTSADAYDDLNLPDDVNCKSEADTYRARDVAFDHAFMNCLGMLGERQASTVGWQELPQLDLLVPSLREQTQARLGLVSGQ